MVQDMSLWSNALLRSTDSLQTITFQLRQFVNGTEGILIVAMHTVWNSEINSASIMPC